MSDVVKTEGEVENPKEIPEVGGDVETGVTPNTGTGEGAQDNTGSGLTPTQESFVDSMFLSAEQRGTTGIPFYDILINNKIAENTKLDPNNTQKNIIKVYGQEIDAAKYTYNRNLATYGIRNERLARQGLMNSGLSDYEKNAAFAELQKSRMTSFENAMNRLDAHKSKMYDLIADEQIKKDSELQGYVNTLITAGLTGESAKMLLAAYGVDPDIAQRIVETTDPVVNQQKTDKVRTALRENGLYGDKAVKYAMQMGLDETTAKALGSEMDEFFADDIATNKEIYAATYQQLRDQGLTDQQIMMKFLTSVENGGYGLTLSEFKAAKAANMAGTTTGADGSTESYTEPNVKNIYEALDGDPNMAATLAQNWGISAEEWQTAMADDNDDLTVEALLRKAADKRYSDNPTARSNVYLQTFLREFEDNENTIADYANAEAFLDANYAAFTAEDMAQARDLLSKSVEVNFITRDFDLLRMNKGFIFGFSLNGSGEIDMRIDFDKCKPIEGDFKKLTVKANENSLASNCEIAICDDKTYLRFGDNGKYTYYEFKGVIKGGSLGKTNAEHMYNLLVNKYS